MMLTQDQKDLLAPLTHHERYGKLLINAMKAWETTTPKQKRYGVSRWNGDAESEWQIEPNNNGCCLIGASILGKSESDTFLEEASISFQLTIAEVLSLAHGFDMADIRWNDDTFAYDFGKQVAKIVFDS